MIKDFWPRVIYDNKKKKWKLPKCPPVERWFGDMLQPCDTLALNHVFREYLIT